MTSENTISDDENVSHFEELKPEIYSSRAIGGFTVFFSTIFGGVLLVQNLRDIDKKKEANIILLFSVLYTIVTVYIIGFCDIKISSLPMLFNFGGSAILTGYFSKKYFPDADDYPKKAIWKPLVISIIIAVPLVLAAIYSQ